MQLKATLDTTSLPAKISKKATTSRKKIFPEIMSSMFDGYAALKLTKVSNNALNKLNLVKFSNVIKGQATALSIKKTERWMVR